MAATGVISGTPTTAGPTTFTVTATNGVGQPAAAIYTLTIAAPDIAPTRHYLPGSPWTRPPASSPAHPPPPGPPRSPSPPPTASASRRPPRTPSPSPRPTSHPRSPQALPPPG